ncbi:MAG TPA: hemolysin family protein [Gemmatimonadaceae bacterium]|nr:hemolysin family protein [Gemmatimonadaceae bacterium]
MEAAEHLSFGAYMWRLAAVILLVLANAFFVAAEFALVGSRRSRIDQMAGEGDRLAKAAQSAIKDLDRYISATQLGITLASLALGWIGEPALAGLVDRFLAMFGVTPPAAAVHTVAGVVTAFVIITFLHIVLGELAPKSIALIKPEAVSRQLALPLIVFAKVMAPAITVLNGAANWLMRRMGIAPQSESHHVHSPDELRLLVMQARAHGTLDETDSAMLAGVFDFHDKKAYDVMRPRTDVAALDVESTEAEVWQVVRRERYSRYPVYRDTLDDVVGVFLAKDLWLYDGKEPFTLVRFVRDALYVPSSRPAERVLDDLRKTRAQMAVVLDEYGGTAGIVTMEDLVEEVVGDIADEYDFASRTAVVTDGVLELAGTLSLVDVRSDYQVPIPEGDWSTLGGYAFGRLGTLPKIGDRVPFPGGELEIIAMDGRRVAGLRVHRDSADKAAATATVSAGAR